MYEYTADGVFLDYLALPARFLTSLISDSLTLRFVSMVLPSGVVTLISMIESGRIAVPAAWRNLGNLGWFRVNIAQEFFNCIMFPRFIWIPLFSVLEIDFFTLKDRITDQSITVQIFSVHINSTDLMIFVGSIIVNSLCGIAAGSIECDLIFAVCDLAAASLLIDGASFFHNRTRKNSL